MKKHLEVEKLKPRLVVQEDTDDIANRKSSQRAGIDGPEAKMTGPLQ